MSKLYTYKSVDDPSWVKLTEKQKANSIRKGLRTENQFVDEEYTKNLPDGSSIMPVKEAESNANLSNVMSRDIENKLAIIEKLSSLYKGDLQEVVDAIANEKKPKFNNKSQQDLYNTVRTILMAQNANDAVDKVASDTENRYSIFLNNVLRRQDLYKTDDGKYRDPTLSEVIFPNLSERKKANSGIGTNAIGVFHDITTLPTRAATAGVSALTPYGNEISFTGQMARPIGASTGPENFVDFAIPGAVGGGAIMGGAKALRSLGKAEKFHDVVRDVNTTRRPLKKVLATGTAKGAAEGAAYSVAPSAALATTPQEENPWLAFGEGVGLGALGGAVVGGATVGGKVGVAKALGRFDDAELPEFARELIIPNQSLRRLQASVKREPILSAAEIEERYSNILDETSAAFKKKLGKEREKEIQRLNEMRFVPTLEPKSNLRHIKSRAPQVFDEDIVIPSNKEMGEVFEYYDADISNPPEFPHVPEYTPSEYRRLIDDIKAEQTKYMREYNEAIALKQQGKAFNKLSRKEKSRIENIIKRHPDVLKQIDDVNASIASGDMNKIYKSLGKTTYGDNMGVYTEAERLSGPIIRPTLQDQIRADEGINFFGEVIPDEDAVYGAEMISPPKTRDKFYIHGREVLPANINLGKPLMLSKFRNSAYNESVDLYPADLEDLYSGEWNRIKQNLSRNDYNLNNIEDEITRLDRLSEKVTDPSKKGMYKDLADRLRDTELRVSEVLSSSNPNSGLPRIRSKFLEGYKTMKMLPDPEKLIGDAATRLRPSTSSKFQGLVKAEEQLNKLRDDNNLPPVDILNAPVASIIRGRIPPAKLGDPSLVQAMEKANRGYVGDAADLAKRGTKAAARGLTRGQTSSAGAVDSPVEYEYPPDVIGMQMLVKGGSAPVRTEPVAKYWGSVDEMWADWQKNQKRKK